jgi:hypothetical protein
MLRTLRKLGTFTLVALATFVLAVPTLALPTCACSAKAAAEKQSLPPCCAKQADGTSCEKPAAPADDCCSGDGSCECPGCNCSIIVPNSVATRAVVTPDPIKLVAPLDLAFDSFAQIAEPSLEFVRSEQLLLQSPAAPLRALYCVWII